MLLAMRTLLESLETTLDRAVKRTHALMNGSCMTVESITESEILDTIRIGTVKGFRLRRVYALQVLR